VRLVVDRPSLMTLLRRRRKWYRLPHGSRTQERPRIKIPRCGRRGRAKSPASLYMIVPPECQRQGMLMLFAIGSNLEFGVA
jgi:hypothetical protein